LPATTLPLLLEWLRPLLRQSNTWWNIPPWAAQAEFPARVNSSSPMPPYIVLYHVRRNAVEVLRVFHAARKWPSGFSNARSTVSSP
jgi:hypothetical protein